MAQQSRPSIRVLVVDDSAVMRTLLVDLLEEDPSLEVVGTAKNGLEALEAVETLEPDIVTLDIEMPKMDGLTALQHIMAEHPLPVIMLSAMNKRQSDITMKALNLGAVDFIPKPSGAISLDIDKIGARIRERIKALADAEVRFRAPHRALRHAKRTRLVKRTGRSPLIIIGASTGGPKSLPAIIELLPRDLPAAMVIVQHMPGGFTRSFAERLNWTTSLEVAEAEDGVRLEPGLAVVAPGDHHLKVVDSHVALDDGARVHNVRPAVDITMKSAAGDYGDRCIGVLLTGMGSDGAVGMEAIRNNGGITIAQDRDSCVVFGMPKAAIQRRVVDHILPLEQIADKLVHLLETMD